MGPNVEGEQDVQMDPTKDFPKMEVQTMEDIGTSEGDSGEDRLILEIQSHDSLLYEIKELQFLLGNS